MASEVDKLSGSERLAMAEAVLFQNAGRVPVIAGCSAPTRPERMELVLRLFEEVPAFHCLKVEVVPAGVKYSEVKRATGALLPVASGSCIC